MLKTLLMFQFHEGPIKTCRVHAADTLSNLFQFHEGPIKTGGPDPAGATTFCFNSMKVRLKHKTTRSVIDDETVSIPWRSD